MTWYSKLLLTKLSVTILAFTDTILVFGDTIISFGDTSCITECDKTETRRLLLNRKEFCLLTPIAKCGKFQSILYYNLTNLFFDYYFLFMEYCWV